MSRSLLLALVVLGTRPLSAQDSDIARLGHRADSLLRAWREAARFADVADSLERARAADGDTIVVGALRIITNPSALPLREAAARAWPVLDSLYGSVAADLVSSPYFIRAVDPDTIAPRRILYVGLEVPWNLDVTATTAILLSSVTPPRFDRALADWLGGGLRPNVRRIDVAPDVFLQLVTAPSEAVRRCFLGDRSRCEDVLQVNDTAGLLARWYSTPAEREGIVVGAFNDYFGRGATAPLLRRCREHSDDACTALLRSLPPNTLPRPLGNSARMLLVREALQIGGREAYRRLVADPAAPIGARLAATAGLPLDSLVVRWRSRALAARPPRITLTWWTSAAALGWTLILGLCALRSSRWRL